MTDPFTATAIAAVVMAEGIKFLYGQAGDLLKRWRDRKEKAATAAAAPDTRPEKVELPPNTAIQGSLTSPEINYEFLAEVEDRLRAERKALNDYADGTETPDPANRQLLARVDSLRMLLEGVYGQTITFVGEQRPPTGTPVALGVVRARIIRGNATGFEVDEMVSGSGTGIVESDEVAEGATATGMKVKKLGG
jgi:hypothetical protein